MTADFEWKIDMRTGALGEEALLEQLWPRAYRLAFLILRDHMASEEVAQESCFRAVLARGRLRDENKFDSWFKSIVTREALSARRSRARLRSREEIVADVPEGAAVADAAHDPDLANALSAMPDDARVPLVLFYYCGFTSDAIGRHLGIKAATIRYRLSAARDQLRKILGGRSND
jgi:RNA polymerase sigma-70 factor (ECF subfamily)